jgi:inner membrane protein
MENQISKLKNNNSPLLKILFILFIILLLMIPNVLIQNLISERANRKAQIEREVAKSYGQAQKVMPPLLRIPYTRIYKSDKDAEISSKEGIFTFTPSTSDLLCNLTTDTRKRSIYEVVVYESEMQIKSQLSDRLISAQTHKDYTFHYDRAHLIVGLTDPNGLSDNSQLKINGQALDLQGVSTYRNGNLRYVKSETFVYKPGQELSVIADLSFKGTKSLMVEPVGEQMKIKIDSPWQDPSFAGTRLPDNYDIAEGFTSTWITNQYAHDYPTSWSDDQKINNKNFGFGVNLIQPINEYGKNSRTAKYALLIIALTFGIFFFFEILLKKKVHPIQYILIGFALTVFYLLLLSITEHLGFDLAYIISAIATIGLIVSYASHLLSSTKSTAILSLLLSGLFGYIFIILQMQDFALLAGALALFTVLTIVMMLSRKINWYALNQSLNPVTQSKSL